MMPVIVEQVVWTNDAKQSFEKIINWVKQNWSAKESNNFVQRTEKMIATFQHYPESCRPSLKRKNVRIGILDKHTQFNISLQ
jgi:plasmid stabilization system protein ParE